MNFPTSESLISSSINVGADMRFEDGATLLKRLLEKRRHDWAGRGKYKEPSLPQASHLPKLPQSWVWASPEQLASGSAYSLAIGPFGSNLKVSDYTASGVPLVFVRNIRAAQFGGDGSKFISESKAASLKAHQVSAGDLLITKMGDPPGDACIYPQFGQDAVITADCMKLQLSPLLDSPQFFVHAINSQAVRSQILDITKGVAQLKVSLGRFATIGIPLPPLQEQRRIVAEIEKQFTRLDTGVTALRQVQAKLKRHRAAILKAACEGRLVSTEAELAHQQNRCYEPASELLTRILIKRREVLRKRGKYKEPAAPNAVSLSPLPEGWTWTRVEQLGEVQLGRQRSPNNISKDFPTLYLRAANITEQGLDLSDVLEMEFSPAERERFAMQNGDVVLSEASGSASQVGKPAVWRNQLPLCCFQNTVIRLRPIFLISAYVLVAFQNCYTNGIFARVAGGVGINHLSVDKFSGIHFPLPPLAEQTRIVEEVERRLSVVNGLAVVIAINLKRSVRLRQSILKRAFAGRL